MKKPKKQGFMEWNRGILISSLKKISLGIILIVILDALFYIISGYIAVFWLQGIQAKVMSIKIPSDILSLGYDRAQQVANEAQLFYYLLIFSFLLVMLAVIFLASILKGVIWAKTTGTKITLRLISRFLLLNLLIMGFMLLLIFFISLIFEPTSARALLLITIISGIYFTNTIYSIFMERQSLKSMGMALSLNITKIHFFAIPYLLFFALLLLVVYLSSMAMLNEGTFFVIANLYSFMGIDVLAAPLFKAQIIQIILAVSFFCNPLLLLSFAVFRHYLSTLVFDVQSR